MINYKYNSDGYMEVTVSGKITKEQIDACWAMMKADMPATGKVKLLEIINDLGGMEISAMWEDMKKGLPMIDKVSHAAIVANQKWIGALVKGADTVMSAEVKSFEHDKLAEARRWIVAE